MLLIFARLMCTRSAESISARAEFSGVARSNACIDARHSVRTHVSFARFSARASFSIAHCWTVCFPSRQESLWGVNCSWSVVFSFSTTSPATVLLLERECHTRNSAASYHAGLPTWQALQGDVSMRRPLPLLKVSGWGRTDLPREPLTLLAPSTVRFALWTPSACAVDTCALDVHAFSGVNHTHTVKANTHTL